MAGKALMTAIVLETVELGIGSDVDRPAPLVPTAAAPSALAALSESRPPEGTLPEGTLPEGSLLAGTVPDGTVPDGTRAERALHPTSRPAPRLTLAWRVHESVRALPLRVCDRLLPDGAGGVIRATIAAADGPGVVARAAGPAPWREQRWAAPGASPRRTVYLQTNAV